jgi:hypothetical protein
MCPSNNEWVEKMWYMMEYYLAIKKNENMWFVGKGIELDTIVLSRISQIQKEEQYMFSLPKYIYI